MATAQAGIFDENTRFHYHLECRTKSATAASSIVNPLRDVIGGMKSGGADAPYLVLGFGPDCWRELAPDQVPQGLENFQALDGVGCTSAPSTQSDIWVWIHGMDHDRNVDLALVVGTALRDVADVQLDVPGYIRHGSRDFIGFEDGLANPKGDRRAEVALLPAGTAGAGGSFAVTQRWILDPLAFHSLPVGEQEAIVGRTKVDGIEFTGDAMPADSHVARTAVTIDGVEQEIYRRSTPYGTVSEHGLHFVAFACDLGRIKIQFERMFGLAGDGLHDRLVDFTRPVSGSYWFVPSQDDRSRVIGA